MSTGQLTVPQAYQGGYQNASTPVVDLMSSFGNDLIKQAAYEKALAKQDIVDARDAEKYNWEVADRKRLLKNRETEDKFNTEVAKGQQVYGGIITDAFSPENANKISFSNDELAQARKVNFDPSKISNKNILEKLKAQEALSTYADNVPTELKETRADMLQRIADEVGTPTDDILKRVDTARAAEIAYAKEYNKQRNQGDTKQEQLDKIDEKLRDANVNLGKAVSNHDKELYDRNKTNKSTSSDKSSSDSSITSAQDNLLKAKDEIISKLFISTGDVNGVISRLDGLNIKDDNAKAYILKSIADKNKGSIYDSLGDTSNEALKGYFNEYNAQKKSLNQNQSPSLPSSAEIEAIKQNINDLTARRAQINSMADNGKLANPRDVALIKAKSDLADLLGRYNIVNKPVVADTIVNKDTIANKDVTKPQNNSSKDKKVIKKKTTTDDVSDGINRKQPVIKSDILESIKQNKTNAMNSIATKLKALENKAIKSKADELYIKSYKQQLNNLKSSLKEPATLGSR